MLLVVPLNVECLIFEFWMFYDAGLRRVSVCSMLCQDV